MKIVRKFVMGLLQTIAVLLLLMAVLSTVLYFNVVSSVEEAQQSGTLPTLLGYSYFPVSEDKFESLGIEKGSIVLADKDNAYAENTVVVFETTDELAYNAVYNAFGIGRVSAVSTGMDGSSAYEIQNLETNQTVLMTDEQVLCGAKLQILSGGKLLNLALTSNGVVFFVILPFFVFVAVQLIVLILHILWNPSRVEATAEEQDASFVANTDEPKRKKERKKRFRKKEEPEEPEIPMHTQLDAIKEETSKPHVHHVFTEEAANSPLTLSFDKRTFDKKWEPKAAEEPTPLKSVASAEKPANMNAFESNDAAELPDELASLLNRARRDVRQTSESIESSPLYTGRSFDKAPVTSDYLDIMSKVNHLLDDIKGEEPGSAANNDMLQEVIDRDMMRGSTVEFNPEKLKPDTTDHKSEQAIRSQQILDNILIQLRENELDVDFNDVSPEVNVAKQPGGNGFTIDTPNYKAKIQVELDRK